MLNDLCRELNNWFPVKKMIGEYTIEDGAIDVGFLHEGQYFRIIGSLFNDGVYKYPTTDLEDETFNGAVWAMAVPKEVIALSDEIDKWSEKYADTANSPYTSESFGGYSYSKATGGDGTSGVSWESVFKHRLNRWRKL